MSRPPLDSGQDRWAAGFRAALPLTLGVAPFAVAFGLAAREVGLSVWSVGAMSLFVFGGAAQYLAVGMLKAGAPLAQIWLATLFLNSRHLLMSTALLSRFAGRPFWLRALGAHAVSDEAFAVASRDPRAGPAFLLGTQSALGLAWIGGSIVGALFGAGLPPALAEAAGFSLVGFFVALIASDTRGLPGWVAVLVGGALALALVGVVPRGWELVLAAAAGASAGALLEARPPQGRWTSPS